MATSRTFQTMLNDYLPNKLLENGMVKRDYFLKNVERDESWKGGPLIVPFEGHRASSVAFGALTAEADINESDFVRGEITTQPEIWGSLVFKERDLSEHGSISEQNLLKILPNEIDAFLDYMKMCVSLSITIGHIFGKATVDGTAGGDVVVDRIERFEKGQPLYLEDDNTAAAKYWVKSVNVNTNTVNLATAVDLVTSADVSAYTVAQNARFYLVGNQTAGNRMTNIKASLLSAVNGGSSTLYGQTKLSYPYLQSINVSGAAITAANLVEKIFDAQTRVRNVGRGMPNTIVMSYKHLGSVLKTLEVSKGAYKAVNAPKAELYGWTEIEIMGVKGSLKIVAIQEMDDDVIFILDMAALKVYSNGFFKKRKNPGNGNEFFEVRATTGYKYIVDVCFFGDLVVERPSRCGIIHSIPNY